MYFHYLVPRQIRSTNSESLIFAVRQTGSLVRYIIEPLNYKVMRLDDPIVTRLVRLVSYSRIPICVPSNRNKSLDGASDGFN